MSRAWDLTALLNAVDPKAALAERNLWLVRLLEWLRRAPVHAEVAGESATTPSSTLRLKHLLNVLERNPDRQQRVSALLGGFWRDVDSTGLLADFGFAPRMHLWGEFARRLRARVLPLTPATNNLADLFGLLFPNAQDAHTLLALDAPTLARLRERLAPTLPAGADWREPFLDAIMFLASAVRSAGFSPALRQRMSPELLIETPFRRLARVAEQLREHIEAGMPADAPELLQEAQYLRGLLEACRRCADSVHEHLEAHGVSVDVVFEVEQLRERTHRIDALLTCVLSPRPEADIVHLLADLIRTAQDQRSVRSLFSGHYSLLARKVAERSAETGEHYITRTRAEYLAMLRAAAGGGAVLAGTTFMKFFLLALGASAFWGGFLAGLNYAASFMLIHLMHWTVATKQPAMTAHALAEKLSDVSSDAGVENFVDEVAHLIRSQMAGIFGNLAVAAPLVLAIQFAGIAAFGAPPIGREDASHMLESLTLLGPTAWYAAFTGVLLFASSLIAGWVENWFVWHRLDSAIAWNPRIVARLGAARAQRWSSYWRANISGFAANISLGLMLGIVPVVAVFFGLPLDVRHVTLSTGQLAAAVGAEGFGLLRQSVFWWCLAGIAATGAANLGVSFWLAFKVALRSRGIRLTDRSRIHAAIRRRLRRRPLSFVLPPRP